MDWFWYFTLYSALGFCLEVGYARCTGGRRDRKGGLLLPLCPVYGLGACGAVLAAEGFTSSPLLVMAVGGLAATGAEYLTALFYDRGLGVSFWDYRDLPWNLGGRVCLPFSLVWGILALPLVYGIHPALEGWVGAIPPPVTWAALGAVGCDLVMAGYLLWYTGDRASLQWYLRE